MQPLAFYLLKVIACSGTLLLYYRLALRNKRFHYYNRFYLLMAMASSLLLPLITFNWFTVQSDSKAIKLLGVINTTNSEVYINTQRVSSYALIDWQLVFAILYISIGVLLIIVLLWRIYKIYRVKKKYVVVNMAEFDFINTDLAQAPFSFLHNLFWRDDIDMNDATGRQVLLHELTHIRQKHTWDKLWMQLITSVLWVNPFFWFIQKELCMLHEFIADEKAIENNDGEAFAAMLLTSQYGKNIFSPAQQFSYSPIKRRLFMLTNLTKPRYSYARRLMVLPLLAAVVLLFAFKLQKKQPAEVQTHSTLPVKIIIDAGHGGSDDGAVVKGVNEKDITLKIANKIKELSATYGVDVLLTRNGDYTVDNKERITFAAGQKVAAFISLHTDYVAPNAELGYAKQQQGIEGFVTKQNPHYDQSALLGSAILHSLSNNFKVSKTLTEREQPAYIISHNNLPALLLECGWMNNTSDLKQMKDEATVELMAKRILEGVVAYANNNNVKTIISFKDSLGTVVPVPMPLIVLSGSIVEKTTIDSLKPDDIESFDVLDRKTSIAKYGDKGVNGVIEVITKNTSLLNPADSIQNKAYRAKELPSNMLYLVDEKVVSKEEVEKIANDDIYSVNVLDSKTATAKYGYKGNNGAMEITMKKSTSVNPANTWNGESETIQLNGDTTRPKAGSIGIAVSADPHLINVNKYAPTDSIEPATFPGGNEEWAKYIDRYIRVNIPSDNGAPPANYTVMVLFTVDTNGNLSQVKAENDPGYGTAAESVRVVDLGPKWIPAKRNGQPVAFTQKEAITFMVGSK